MLRPIAVELEPLAVVLLPIAVEEKALAVVERPMAVAPWPWNGFAHSLGRRELPRLDYLYGGVGYRLPPPGAVIEEGMLKANAAFPGLTLHYTTDGTEPTTTSSLYTGPVAVSGTVKVRTFDTRGRSSRTAVVAE